MNLQSGKEKFIEDWGNLGVNWGVCRTMAQIHALLLVSNKEMCTDQIMDELDISRGNASKNLNALVEWELVYKNSHEGARKDFYSAEKDIWKVFKRVLIERKKQELEPMIKALDDVSCVEGNCEESDEFCKMVRELKHFSQKTDKALDTLIKTDSNGLLGKMFNWV